MNLTRSGPRGASEPLKASVLAALLLGQPSEQIAQQFGLPVGTVRDWEQNFAITNPVERKTRLGMMILTFVEQEIASLMSVSLALSDEDWIKSQSASSIADLLDIRHQRLMNILEAFGRGSAQAAQAQNQMSIRAES